MQESIGTQLPAAESFLAYLEIIMVAVLLTLAFSVARDLDPNYIIQIPQ